MIKKAGDNLQNVVTYFKHSFDYLSCKEITYLEYFQQHYRNTFNIYIMFDQLDKIEDYTDTVEDNNNNDKLPVPPNTFVASNSWMNRLAVQKK